MSEKNKPIGVFDSGIGGLTVAAELFRQLPEEKIIYFGDTGRYPYGVRSQPVIQRFSRQAVRFLLEKDAKLIVVACNTATAMALDVLQAEFSVPIIGVVEPGSRAAAGASKNRNVGVIGTLGTIRSGSYERTIKRMAPDIQVFSLPCPLFVPLAEEGFADHKATLLIAQDYLASFKKFSIDTLVLGCTHYPLLKKAIGRVVGPAVRLVDSAEETAGEVKDELTRLNLLRPDGHPLPEYYVSDTPEKFVEVGQRFLGDKIDRAALVDIEKYFGQPKAPAIV
ncbi:MAG: glutamate racemase [candidate division Zixibacteria bacterium]|nr:glutamate racemase [candidate division Zixibacteria bacterium]